MQEDTFLRGNPAYVLKGIHLLRGNPKEIHQTGVKWPSNATFRWYESRIKSLFYHSFKLIPSLKLTSIDDKFIFDSACSSANLGGKGLFRCANILWIADVIRRVVFLLFLLFFSGLEVNFLVHLQSFASNIFSTSKLVRPLANIFPLKCQWPHLI